MIVDLSKEKESSTQCVSKYSLQVSGSLKLVLTEFVCALHCRHVLTCVMYIYRVLLCVCSVYRVLT